MSTLNYGDHLISPRIGYEHHGIYVGNNCVFRRS
ncbi:lecithin retinol acyltransferase family protein [Aeromonas veronii]